MGAWLEEGPSRGRAESSLFPELSQGWILARVVSSEGSMQGGDHDSCLDDASDVTEDEVTSTRVSHVALCKSLTASSSCQ